MLASADEEDAVSGPPVAPPVVAADEKLRRDDLGVVVGVEEGEGVHVEGCTEGCIGRVHDGGTRRYRGTRGYRGTWGAWKISWEIHVATHAVRK